MIKLSGGWKPPLLGLCQFIRYGFPSYARARPYILRENRRRPRSGGFQPPKFTSFLFTIDPSWQKHYFYSLKAISRKNTDSKIIKLSGGWKPPLLGLCQFIRYGFSSYARARPCIIRKNRRRPRSGGFQPPNFISLLFTPPPWQKHYFTLIKLSGGWKPPLLGLRQFIRYGFPSYARARPYIIRENRRRPRSGGFQPPNFTSLSYSIQSRNVYSIGNSIGNSIGKR